MRRRNPEQLFQMVVAQHLETFLLPPAIFTAFPAGGGGKTRGAFLKAMGLKPGWPDILVLHAGKLIGLELKAGSRVHRSQAATHSAIERAGGTVFICRGLEDIDAALLYSGVPMRPHSFLASGVARVAG